MQTARPVWSASSPVPIWSSLLLFRSQRHRPYVTPRSWRNAHTALKTKEIEDDDISEQGDRNNAQEPFEMGGVRNNSTEPARGKLQNELEGGYGSNLDGAIDTKKTLSREVVAGNKNHSKLQSLKSQTHTTNPSDNQRPFTFRKHTIGSSVTPRLSPNVRIRRVSKNTDISQRQADKDKPVQRGPKPGTWVPEGFDSEPAKSELGSLWENPSSDVQAARAQLNEQLKSTLLGLESNGPKASNPSSTKRKSAHPTISQDDTASANIAGPSAVTKAQKKKPRKGGQSDRVQSEVARGGTSTPEPTGPRPPATLHVQDRQTSQGRTAAEVRPRRPSLVRSDGNNDILQSLKHLSMVTGRILEYMAKKAPGVDFTGAEGKGLGAAIEKPATVEQVLTDGERTSESKDTQAKDKPGETGEPTAAVARKQLSKISTTEHVFTQVMESIMTASDTRDGRRQLVRDKLRHWNRYSESFTEPPLEDTNNTKPDSARPVAGPPQEEPLEARASEKVQRAFTPEEPIITRKKSTKAVASGSQQAGSMLYEQLFPEATAQKQIEASRGQVAEILNPEEALPVPVAKQSAVEALHQNGMTIPDVGITTPRQSSGKAAGKLSPHAAVLMLRGVSMDLTEEDIRRLVPRGKHLPDWYAKEDIIHVIPRRDPLTLRRYPDYYLVFRNQSAADKYRSAAQKLLGYAAQYTPSSILSPIMPGKGQIINSMDVATVVKNFTLAVPGQKLHFQALPRPWDHFLENLFRRGGYPQILPVPGVKKPQVLLTFEGGFAPSQLDIVAAIAKDGEQRNLAWKLEEPFHESVQRLETKNARGWEEEGSPSEDDNSQPSRDSARWIVAFQDEVEARRFAHNWHMKQLPVEKTLLRDRGLRRDQVPTCVTELLW